jgi:hypothetical protein
MSLEGKENSLQTVEGLLKNSLPGEAILYCRLFTRVVYGAETNISQSGKHVCLVANYESTQKQPSGRVTK